MQITDYMKTHFLILDGGMGTLLQEQGLAAGEYPERWNISHPDVIQTIHRSYFEAGSNVVSTNTFGANSLKFSHDELKKIITCAVENAKLARQTAHCTQPKYIALDIGPTGRLLAPYGDFDFEEAVSVFAETVRLGVACGVDLILIETMNDSYETKAALLAAKENSDLPVFVSNAYGEDKKLMTGASPSAMVAMLEGMGADAIGANCSLGPRQLRGVAEELLASASVPVLLKPNAGLPKSVEGKTLYDVNPTEFADEIASLLTEGLRIAGGCCGTTPDYIRAVAERAEAITPVPLSAKHITCVSSYSHVVTFGQEPILIGERINPTGKKRLKEALRNHDLDYILQEGISQQEKGVHILDVNVGLPEIDEAAMLETCVCELQAILNLPLQIDTSDAVAMERALRRYNGKAMINSVNGKQESMDAIFPLVKKYGGLVVALTLDENGIPETAEGRVKIAERILHTAATYGIRREDIIFDTLAMTVSADNRAALATLGALSTIRHQLGCHTSLGVSNVSFGLPARDAVNGVFFATALESGLSAAIMNPHSGEMMKTYYAYRALHGLDENCADYIRFMEDYVETVATPQAAKPTNETSQSFATQLQRAVVKGLKEQAASATIELLQGREPLAIVTEELIPALDVVGRGFEAKTVYLPQLLMSAEAAKAAFEVIKSHVSATQSAMPAKCSFVLATVKGDIHDIGKNIVKLLLENYGFTVVDLGKDVEPKAVLEAVRRTHAPLAGLSALMTTTVPAMEETIRLLHEQAPWCHVVVGGAVLTQDYADSIGADQYAKDAMDTVRYAEAINAAL